MCESAPVFVTENHAEFNAGAAIRNGRSFDGTAVSAEV